MRAIAVGLITGHRDEFEVEEFLKQDAPDGIGKCRFRVAKRKNDRDDGHS